MRNERVMTIYENDDVIAFKSCIQKSTVYKLIIKYSVASQLRVILKTLSSVRLKKGGSSFEAT